MQDKLLCDDVYKWPSNESQGCVEARPPLLFLHNHTLFYHKLIRAELDKPLGYSIFLCLFILYISILINCMYLSQPSPPGAY